MLVYFDWHQPMMPSMPNYDAISVGTAYILAIFLYSDIPVLFVSTDNSRQASFVFGQNSVAVYRVEQRSRTCFFDILLIAQYS